MATNTIKHRMLVDAKRIANTEFKDTKEIKVENDILITKYTNASMNREIEIDFILEEHPEYDEDKFRKMIKTFEKEKGIKENVDEFNDK